VELTIDQDLKDVLLQINTKLDNLQKDVTDIKIDLATTKAELKGDLKALDEKVTGIGKRLENQEFVSRSIVVALVIAILGGFAKLFGLIGNP
jgi:uncharacterized protein (DUF849 family)